MLCTSFERTEKMWETALQTPRRRCSRCWSRDSPVACGEDHTEADCPNAAYGGPQCSRYSSCCPRMTPHQSRWIHPEWNCSPWRACARAGFWQELRPMWDPNWSSLFLEDYWEDLCWISYWSKVLWKDVHWSSSWRTVSHGRNSMLEQGMSIRRKERRKKELWTDCNSLLPFCCSSRRRATT